MHYLTDVGFVKQLLQFLEEKAIPHTELQLEHIANKNPSILDLKYIPTWQFIDLLESAAKNSGNHDLGLQFIHWLKPHQMSILSKMSRYCASIDEHIQLASHYSQLENNAIIFEAQQTKDHTTVVIDLINTLHTQAVQFSDTQLAITYRLYQEMLGKHWRCTRIDFRGSRKSLQSYQKFFKCELRFNCKQQAMVIPADVYRHPSEQADKEMLSIVTGYLDERMSMMQLSIADKVDYLVSCELSRGNATLHNVASLLAMDSRTLQRKLSNQGTSFSVILKSVRVETLRKLQKNDSPLTVNQLATALGYSDASSLCHFKQTLSKPH